MTTELDKVYKRVMKNLETEAGPTTVARLLKHYRDSFGITQLSLGKKLGITKQHVCDLEKGRRLISLEMAAKIARKLKEPEKYWVKVAIDDQLKKAHIDLIVVVKDSA